MNKTSTEKYRNLHNEAMDILSFARLGFDPRDKNRTYTETEKINELEKALKLEHQAIALVQERYDRTQDDSDKLTESIYSRSGSWIAIKAQKFDEAERIALTALARGAHPEEKEKLLDALFTATKKQGYHLHSFEEDSANTVEVEQKKELVEV